jgi:DNA ligase 1
MLYKELCNVYDKLEKTSKRLEKTEYISELLKKTPKEDMTKVMLLVQGNIYPEWDDRKVGVASRIVLKAISIASGIPQNKIEDEWKKTGDLGIVSENMIRKKRQSTLFQKSLTLNDVFNNLRKLSELEGESHRLNQLRQDTL